MTYLNDDQIAQLLKAINPSRVSKDPKGFSYVEAYELRAHLIRIFGPCRWSSDVTDQQIVFESSETRRKKDKQGKEYGDPYEAWTVCYRTILRLTIYAPDGTELATYTEGATGVSQNQPTRSDAHDNALKTSESQAFKRCCMNLGDNFGLSLWGKGSTAALVKQTLITERVADSRVPVDAHITEPPAPEGEPADPADEPRTTTAPPVETPEKAEQIRAALLAGPGGLDPRKWLQDLTREAGQAKVLSAKVEDANGKQVALKVLLETEFKFRTAA